MTKWYSVVFISLCLSCLLVQSDAGLLKSAGEFATGMAAAWGIDACSLRKFGFNTITEHLFEVCLKKFK